MHILKDIPHIHIVTRIIHSSYHLGSSRRAYFYFTGVAVPGCKSARTLKGPTAKPRLFFWRPQVMRFLAVMVLWAA